MKIAEYYSHLNGLEFLLVHKPSLWKEIQDVIKRADATLCQTKVSKEIRSQGKLLYSPRAMNKAIREGFAGHKWEERRISYWVTSDARLIRKTMFMGAAQQKEEIEGAGLKPLHLTIKQISSRSALQSKFNSASTRSLLMIFL